MNSRWSIWLLAFALGIASTNAVADDASSRGKIYLGGAWIELENHPLVSRTDTNSLFNFAGAPHDFRALVREFLGFNASLFGLKGSSRLASVQVQSGPELETHRFQKSWNGLRVLGGDALVHLQNGKVVFASADPTPLDGLTASPRLSAEESRQLALASYRGSALRAETPELTVLLTGTGSNRAARLVYSVKVLDADQFSSDIHFIDALSGQEALVTTNVHTIADRKVFAGMGTEDDFEIVSADDEHQIDQKFQTLYSDKGCPSQHSGFSFWEKPSDSIADTRACGNAAQPVMASALAAWNNSGLVYDYYQSVHRRNSLDGKGIQIRSVVNFGGSSFQNAAWFNDRHIMLYGMGDASRFNDFALPLDVVGHEITHGVTSSTAALEYSSESGALNESYSDVFGKLIAFRNGKGTEWKIGRELFRDGTSFIRDMENPEIAHTKDFKYRGQPCNRFNDFCGVHDNSGIPNKAAVAIAKALGLEKMGRLYYLTLTQLLRSSSDFKEARAQTEAACTTLFGSASNDCRAVSNAFAAVGI